MPNCCPQTLMSHYGFWFWNIKKNICVLCRSICMCIFTILKLVISFKARKQIWFYSDKGSLFHESLAQFWFFFSYNLVLKLHRYELVFGIMWCTDVLYFNVSNMISIFRYFDKVLICLKMPLVFVITATTTQNTHF